MVTDILLAIFGGGATGLFGSISSRIFKYFETNQQQKFLLEQYKLEQQLKSQEIEESQHHTIISSYTHDTNTGTASKWVINILRLIRPTITLFLWILVAMIWLTINNQDSGNLKVEDFKAQTISTIMYCATAATLWWFGSRDSRKN